MDPLTQQLMQRQMQATPPSPATKVPPEAKRFANTQQIMNAYRGDWTPNPVLLRASLGTR